MDYQRKTGIVFNYIWFPLSVKLLVKLVWFVGENGMLSSSVVVAIFNQIKMISSQCKQSEPEWTDPVDHFVHSREGTLFPFDCTSDGQSATAPWQLDLTESLWQSWVVNTNQFDWTIEINCCLLVHVRSFRSSMMNWSFGQHFRLGFTLTLTRSRGEAPELCLNKQTCQLQASDCNQSDQQWWTFHSSNGMPTIRVLVVPNRTTFQLAIGLWSIIVM